jgi:hypothetical protein
MSQARIQYSTFAGRLGKTIKCGKCGRDIPKGERYRWYKVGFRSRYKNIRCYRSECTPRSSELESSLMAGVYSAIEGAEDALAALDAGEPEDDASSIAEAVTDAADGVREVADQYSEAADAMGDAGYDMQEKADEIGSAADELEGYSAGDDEPDLDQCDNEAHDLEEADAGWIERGDRSCESCTEIKRDWWTQEISAAQTALSNVSF